MLTHPLFAARRAVFVFVILLSSVVSACGGTAAPTAVVDPAPAAATPSVVAAVAATEAITAADTAPTLVAASPITATPPISVTAEAPTAEAAKSPEQIRLEKLIATVEQVAKEHGVEVFADQTISLDLLGGEKRSIMMGGDKVSRPLEIPTQDGDMLKGEELSLAQRQAMANEGLKLIVQEHPDLDLSKIEIIDPQYENEKGDNITIQGLKIRIVIMCNSVPSANSLALALDRALIGQVDTEFYRPEGTGIGANWLLDRSTGTFITIAGLFNTEITEDVGLAGSIMPAIVDVNSAIGRELVAMAGGEENANWAKIFTPGRIFFSFSGNLVARMPVALDRMNGVSGTNYKLEQFVIK